MNEHSKTTGKPALLNLADRMIEAQQELDEFTLQLALGKAEAKEKFEEVKKQFSFRLTNLKRTFAIQKIESLSKEITAKLDELEKVLNVGMVKDKENFVVQQRLIIKSLIAFEDEVRNRLPANQDAQYFAHEIEIFKLKMEILRLRFVLKRFLVKDDFKSNIDGARKKVANLIEKAREKVRSGEKRIVAVKKDIKRAYRKAEKVFS